ncbi:MAG: HPr family phosphocarrier protein [Anaerolinea sp.]|nr:HPr family phosphocarrier protein [Anaerolinea sp.]
MSEINVIIKHPEGLHARPAALLARMAQQFQSDIKVILGRWSADAKSILEILTLGADQGAEVCVSADGEDADQAVEAIREFVEANFGEEIIERDETGEPQELDKPDEPDHTQDQTPS